MFQSINSQPQSIVRIPLFLLALIVAVLLLSTQSVVASHVDRGRYSVESYSSIEGLVHDDVQDIMQDSAGFIWVATNGGLSRFDGTEFVNYSRGDRGLGSILILSLCEDRYRNIWIGTADKGLYYYVRDENRFLHSSEMCSFEHIAAIETARYICEGDDGDIWFYARLSRSVVRMRFDIDTHTIVSLKHYQISSTTTSYPSRMLYADGSLYACTAFGLLRYSERSDSFEIMKGFEYTVNDICRRGNKLFLMTIASGLKSYDLKSGAKVDYKGISSSRRICWVGDDLYYVSNQGLLFSHYDSNSDSFSPSELVERYDKFFVNDLISLRTGEVCAGFIKKSLRIYNRNTKLFQLVGYFGNNHIQPVFIDGDRWLWVGTEASGYYLYDMQSGQKGAKQRWLHRSAVSAIAKSDYDSKYYIASTQGICRVDHIGAKPDLITEVTMVKHMTTDQRYLWIATYSRGLIRYDLSSGERLELTVDNSGIGSNIVRCVIADSGGSLWISTDKGLFTIDKESKDAAMPIVEAVMAQYTSSHYIIPIYESKSGDIWYGTLGSGLHRLMRNERGEIYNIESYDTNNLLPSNIINSMVEDNEGRLWVATHRELTLLDLDEHISTIYNIGNGLSNIGFHDVSFARHADGRIAFGGSRGVTILDPREIKVDSISVTPCFTDLKIWGKSILFDSEPIERVSDRAIEFSECITLSHDQNSFALSVSGFNYTGVKSQSYSYRLYGFDRGWTTLESPRREISYTNIPHGRYRLAVVGSNGDGIQGPFKRSVEIVVNPPLWLTWYAYLGYVVLIISGVVFFMLYYKRVLERENAVRMARMEKSKVEELLNYRTRFITNVSHEFRTPLTLIISPLQRMMADPRSEEIPEWRECFDTMQHNANRLLFLSSEFLSYQKRDNKELRLNLKYARLDQLVERLSAHFRYLGESRGVNVEYLTDFDPIYLYYDEEYIEQIIYNLVSNGVKYTRKGGAVVISLKSDEQGVVLEVSDNGVGISPEVREQIFNRFASYDTNIADSSVSGIGIGLSLTRELILLHGGEISFESEEGVGTTFTVRFYKTSEDHHVDEPLQEVEPQPSVELVEELSDFNHDNSKGVMLVVDDNAQICKVLVTLFEGDGGYSVLTAGNGAEGLEMAKRFIPDIIVTDVMMPIMDGLEFCERVKCEVTTSHIPVVMLTAKSADSDVARGYEYRADGYCTKPFDNDVLRSLVGSILANRKALAQRVKHSESSSVEVDRSVVTTRQDQVLLARLSEYIEEQIGNAELKVSDLCSEVGLTQVVLNKKLRSLLDMTANQLIRHIRIKRAAELLRTGRYTVASITYDMGFNDLRHFRESFKKEFGVFPQEYKKQFNDK